MHVWLRAEHRTSERRSPLTPHGAAVLLEAGNKVTVEASEHRIFSNDAFRDVGCEIVPHGTWSGAPSSAYILGLKELPESPPNLHHRHIYFGHAYKNQAKAPDILTRFCQGDGILLDLEYLCDNDNQRVVAFGYWAGYVGAALAFIHWGTREQRGLDGISKSLLPYTNETQINIIAKTSLNEKKPRVLIIGAYGRCGLGATKMCQRHNVTPTLWGRNETQDLDRKDLLAHDILINCTLMMHPVKPFLRAEDIALPRKLSVISDISCDQGNPLNPLPIIAETTEWDAPVRRLNPLLHHQDSLDAIAIDNLASILPRESSEDFANALLPHLLDLPNANNICWQNAQKAFESHTINRKRQHHFKLASAKLG